MERTVSDMGVRGSCSGCFTLHAVVRRPAYSLNLTYGAARMGNSKLGYNSLGSVVETGFTGHYCCLLGTNLSLSAPASGRTSPV